MSLIDVSPGRFPSHTEAVDQVFVDPKEAIVVVDLSARSRSNDFVKRGRASSAVTSTWLSSRLIEQRHIKTRTRELIIDSL